MKQSWHLLNDREKEAHLDALRANNPDGIPMERVHAATLRFVSDSANLTELQARLTCRAALSVLSPVPHVCRPGALLQFANNLSALQGALATMQAQVAKVQAAVADAIDLAVPPPVEPCGDSMYTFCISEAAMSEADLYKPAKKGD